MTLSYIDKAPQNAKNHNLPDKTWLYDKQEEHGLKGDAHMGKFGFYQTFNKRGFSPLPSHHPSLLSSPFSPPSPFPPPSPPPSFPFPIAKPPFSGHYSSTSIPPSLWALSPINIVPSGAIPRAHAHISAAHASEWGGSLFDGLVFGLCLSAAG